MKRFAPLKVSEVAKLLGWTNDRTRRHLKAANQRAGGTLLQWTSDDGHILISKKAMQIAFPDFGALENPEEQIAAIDEKVDEVREDMRLTISHVGSLSRRVAKFERQRAA